jgi:hypothetical protein
VDIYIRTQGKNYYLESKDELKSQISAGRVPFSAWLFLDEEWTLLAEHAELRKAHPEFEERPKAAPVKAKSTDGIEALAPPAVMGATISAESVWFYIKDKKKYGPYSAADLISKVQSKHIEPSAFVWRPGFATWQRLSQLAEFSRDSMKNIAKNAAGVDILVKRKFTRAPYEVEVSAHDNTKVIEGKTMVIGEGGLFLAVPRPSHLVGARLKLHFREGDTAPFNAVAEVVSVVRGSTPGYCMRFVALSDTDRRRIAKFVVDRK